MKRVLIVTYDFPPVGGSGVQRIAKFVKYLPRLGWQPVVLTTRLGRSVPRDSSLLEDLGSVEIHRTAAPDPYRLTAFITRGIRKGDDRIPKRLHGSELGPWHPGAWLVPDAKVTWVPFGLSWALDRSAEAGCDVVLSTVPTPAAAILGSAIARLWRVPHVIDYRDPWSGAFYLPRRLEPLRRVEAAWERRILGEASAAVIVPGVNEHLPNVGTPVETIHNGYDEEDFARIEPRRPPGGGFVIAHVGILWKDRDLTPIAEALRLLRARRPDLAERLHFLQVGQVDQHVARQLESNTPGVRISFRPYVSHRDAIAYMRGADLLYLPTSHDCMPGKTYEYLRSRKPIVGLGAPGSHLDRLIAKTGGGTVVPHADFSGIARVIEHVMSDPRAYRPPRPDVLSAYSREAGTRQLTDLLNALTRRPS